MTIKDIIKDTAIILGDETLYAALSDATQELSGENKAKTDVFLKCYNDTLAEVATAYYPITKEETIQPGKTLFSSLSETPLRIKSVRAQSGVALVFSVGEGYLETEKVAGELTVVYDYIPSEKTADGDFEYEKTPLGKTVFCYGIAAEYCMIGGRYSEAANWESKFKNAVAGIIQPKKRAGKITTSRVWK